MKTLLGAILTLSFCSVTAAAERVALVIGVNNYSAYPQHKQLTSARNDAEDMTAVLRKIGFDVQEPVLDGGRQEIMEAKRRFLQEAKGARIALFYFSGHGLQVGDENYLMPADMPPVTSFTVMRENAIQLRDSVMAGLEEAGAGTKIIILDCCRDNPFASQIAEALGTKSFRTKGGSGEITGYGPGFFLAFASSPGATALDGNGTRNSPFTAALLTRLKENVGLNIRDLLDEVKSDMQARSGPEQVPWVNDSLNKDHIKVLTNLATLQPSTTSHVMPVVPTVPATPPAAIEMRITKPFTNSLGMKFVSVPGTHIMMCIHETRNTDYAAYARAQSGVDADWLREAKTGKELHPVVHVNCADAEAFCYWLSAKERKVYRLPTDAEWSVAVGRFDHPWGNTFPPGPKDGNYSKYLVNDGFDGTAPVMSFSPNELGIYDLGGNVWEWCGTWYTTNLNDSMVFSKYPFLRDDQGGHAYRVLRGASWGDNDVVFMRSSCRKYSKPNTLRYDMHGFRCVLEMP